MANLRFSAASALLISSAVLFWKVQNRQSDAATTFSQSGNLNGKPHVPAPGAAELFLRGRYYWNLRTADGLAKAIDSYTQAIVTDPSYAEAYAGLAEFYDLLPQFGQADLGDSLRKAERAADRAIELDPNLASAHTARRSPSITGIGTSPARTPNSAKLSHSIETRRKPTSGTRAPCRCRSEGAEAVRQIDEAVRLDPTSPAIAADAALFMLSFGDFDAGMKALLEIEQTQPTLATPADFLRALDFSTGNYAGYVADARHYASITRAPDDVALAEAVARGWAEGGRTGLFQARARVLKAAFDRNADSGYKFGQSLLLLGRSKVCIAILQGGALNKRYILLITMQQCPWAKSLSRAIPAMPHSSLKFKSAFTEATWLTRQSFQ